MSFSEAHNIAMISSIQSDTNGKSNTNDKSDTNGMTVKKGDENVQQTFLHKCLKKILKIWPLKVRNVICTAISKTIKRHRWTWLRQALRMGGTKQSEPLN